MADVQIAVIDPEDTQLALAAPAEAVVNVAVPGIQGPVGTTGSVTIAQAGTAATPGIRFESDTNTGIYSPGADQLAVSTGGTGRLFVSSNGYIGVGNSNPESAAITPGLVLGDGTDNKGLMLYGTSSSQQNIAFTDTAATQQGLIQYDHSSDYMRFFTAATEAARIDASGRVGIGTGSPEYALEVRGVVGSTSAGGIKTVLSFASEGIVGTLSNHALALYTNATERLRIDSSGRVGIGTSVPGTYLDTRGFASYRGNAFAIASFAANNTLAPLNICQSENGTAPAISAGQNSSGVYQPLVLMTSEQKRVLIDAAGNVGIGTTSPTTLLDVNADTVRVRTARTPASASATGATGEICWDASYIYVCTATNTWKRSALSTW